MGRQRSSKRRIMLIHLEKILFYCLIFCLPFQTRKIFYQWGNDFNEWISVYLYLTDILLILVFLLWFWRVIKQNQGQSLLKGTVPVIIKNPIFWLGLFIVISLISLIQADNFQLGFYHWIKLLEMAGLFFYLKYNFKQLFSFKKIAYVFIASGLFQSVIALGQCIQQKSLGLKLLAESPLGPEIAGVAKIIVNETKMIRPYGTFPHPNILAVFLLISIFFLYFLWLSKKHSFIKNCLMLAIFGFLIFTLWLTFSRIIIFAFLLASLIYFITLFRQNRKKIFILFLLFVIFNSLFFVLALPEISSRFSVSLTEQSVGLRVFYTQAAFSIIKDCPFLGIGIGNFVWEIRYMINLLASWLHQPVHNIYLLIASETGLTGLFVFLFFIFSLLNQSIRHKALNNKQYHLLFILFCFLFIGLFDHFFWTLQQGQLMLWLILGIIGANHLY